MNKNKKLINSIAIIMWITIIAYIMKNAISTPRYGLIFTKNEMLINSIGLTVGMSIIILIISMIVGFVMYLMEESKNYFIKYFTIAFKEITMGTPLIVMIFLVTYVLAPNIGITNKTTLGIISIVIYMSSYISNSYRAVIGMINEEQDMILELYNFNTYQKYSSQALKLPVVFMCVCVCVCVCVWCDTEHTADFNLCKLNLW